MVKPLDIECPTCHSCHSQPCYDKARGDFFPDGIFHASRIGSYDGWAVDCRQPSLFPDDQPKQMTLSQRYGDMEIK